MTAGTAERQAARLLRWYPASWRARYGEEFAELLLADLAEQPRNWRRSADVAAHGLLARLTVTGLTTRSQPPAVQMATLGCALAAFGTLGVAMLAQLATGWQWVSSGSPSVAGATVLMTVAAACIAIIGLVAAVPLLWRILLAARRRDVRVIRPAGLAVACAAALVAGARHFQNSWPGTGGTGAEHSLVPGGVAAFAWSSTLSVSSFWVHPALLIRFPAAELAWMAASPVIGITLMIAAATAVRRLALAGGVVGYLSWLARAACLAAAAFLAGAAIWVVGQGGGDAGLFRPGLVDGAELVSMAIALAVALRLTGTLSRERAT
ncbi:MAG TPA: hypothetical protein VMA73_13525 [Streptosporangiaceae bacterium]|nr:hypothetical protein [Streptosporangiaceae bacterium]